MQFEDRFSKYASQEFQEDLGTVFSWIQLYKGDPVLAKGESGRPEMKEPYSHETFLKYTEKINDLRSKYAKKSGVKGKDCSTATDPLAAAFSMDLAWLIKEAERYVRDVAEIYKEVRSNEIAKFNEAKKKLSDQNEWADKLLDKLYVDC